MSELVRVRLTQFLIVSAFSLCLALSAILIWEYWLISHFAADFAVFWRTANNPVSEAYAHHGRGPFAYPPPMLLWIQPLSLFSFWPAYFLLGAFSVSLYGLAFRRHVSQPALILAMISPPFIRCLRNGQLSAILSAVIIWACASSNRIAAGIALGLVASVKPQLVALAPLMLALNRDWKAFASAGIAYVSVALLATVAFGPERWVEWFSSLASFKAIVAGSNIINIGISPAIVAEKFGLNPLPFLIAGTALGAWLVYACRDLGPLEKATAIGAGSLLATPYALAYDLVIVAPFVASQLMKGRPAAFIAVTGMLNPIPLFAAVFELASRNRPSEEKQFAQVPVSG